MADWTEKYRPATKSEVRGNDTARDALWEWAETWDDHREAVVLHGSPGVGKTSAAHALAADMGWETVELNASDQRTGDVIERLAGRAARNATLAGSADASTKGQADRGRQLVVMDEADNIHGTHDRGGKQAVTDLVKSANQPVVLIANEYYEMSRGLRNATREIEFNDVSARSIVPVLRHICREEGVEYESDALQRIAEANSGDLRSAVKDLQASVRTGDRDRVTVEDVTTGSRDRSVGVFPFLDTVLKEGTAREALQESYDVDETPDDLTRWIEENVGKVYEGAELARAYEHLANADVWLGRVVADDFEYKYWRYAGDDLAAGVAAARDGTKGGWTRYSRPQFWPSSDATADEVARRVAAEGGYSMATAHRRVLPFLSAMTHHCKPRELTVAMTAFYDFEASHVSFVTGSGESTNKVQSIVEDARGLRDEALEEHAGAAFAPATGDLDGTGDADAAGASDGGEADGGPQQATLGADPGGDAAEGSDDHADAVDEDDEDDGQSGLSDFF
jgi:replication factor C large subunit